MEISSLYPQAMSTMEAPVEDRAPVSQKAGGATQNAENQASAEDRVDLVTAQNLASPSEVQLDVNQALQLLQQVQQDFSRTDRQDLGGVFQFDRLRDLCAQVQEAQF
jgi:hypothetical protein